MIIAEDSTTFFAQTQEFDVVVLDQKIVFLGQDLFRFFHQLQLVPDEVAIIDNLPAVGADEMMVMVFFVFAFELVPALAVPGSHLLDKPEPTQEFQGAIDRGQAYPGVQGIQRGIDLFGAQVLSGPAQEIEDDLTRHRPAGNVVPKPMLPLVSFTHGAVPYR
jgi:hypothetical protein